MSMNTAREDLTQAVLEGVAFALRDSMEVARTLGIAPKKSKICGGGAKSALWKKIIANVLNMELEIVENEEGPALGGAILAAVACGAYPDVTEATKQIVKVVDVVKPTPELVKKYDEKYEQFKQIYPTCKALFAMIHE
jgi:xylulokinase